MRCRGFTLLELMVVLLIAGILLAAGVPMLQALTAEQQLVAAGNAFFHSATLTRSEALRRGATARMTPNDGRDWASGWKIDTGERVVMTQSPLPAGISVSYTTGGELVAYQPGGQPVAFGSWLFSSGARTRVVRINFLGRARVCNPEAERNCDPG
ncbi:GspH/FimT family pseudopilin [Herbaspirillum sp. LeCh32-8]|uniref:GspH/FimT family pseudopilin n=1 Tax=Herbaspirillum sp. LeCh32-8 TaxID=2821356 RepID=UPI001AE87B04|nr:GspH/FimT family pseudopilin [Herbaspirillum sp. LeCh32-8]MBP0597606.1 GspH/FimT family pseudopilin [Herbaspirillum sp. LeCh32-8]